MIHRINIFLLSLLVALAPNFIFLQAANATTVAGEGWSVTKRLVQGATTFYDGAKNVVLNGKNYAATGAAAITPTASQVSKMIVRTGAVVAVDLAIKALIGSVDYVMDPANNQVKYYVSPPTSSPSDQYYWVNGNSQNIKYSSSRAALDGHLAYLCASGGTWGACPDQIKSISGPTTLSYGVSYTVTRTNNSTVTYNMTKVANPAYDPNAQPNREEKYLPYDAVASQLISDAVANKADGKAYVSSVADTALEDEQRQIVPATDITNQLNNSQAIPTNNAAQGTSTPRADPNDPTAPPAPPTDITINFPVFCDWAPSVCQAANAAINFPKLFVEKFQKWDDWLNRETKPYTADETKIDTEDKRTFDFSVFNTNRFSVDDKCPTPEPQTITVLNVTTSFTLSLQPVCSILELAKPALIACSYIYAAYIVIGAAKGG
ncbi:virulence factor TspB C-terminal domain-related protein [Acinetobacter baumannii]|uniref:virulence factor TspB C-terminal domain-related protein n=1 Tax=Acinetobacter baumannii TaxID=470 RepID=UPI0023415154|nr:virulence factor TspB C-terminal domain-related protein [Acinetobacter baumannii]